MDPIRNTGNAPNMPRDTPVGAPGDAPGNATNRPRPQDAAQRALGRQRIFAMAQANLPAPDTGPAEDVPAPYGERMYQNNAGRPFSVTKAQFAGEDYIILTIDSSAMGHLHKALGDMTDIALAHSTGREAMNDVQTNYNMIMQDLHNMFQDVAHVTPDILNALCRQAEARMQGAETLRDALERQLVDFSVDQGALPDARLSHRERNAVDGLVMEQGGAQMRQDIALLNNVRALDRLTRSAADLQAQAETRVAQFQQREMALIAQAQTETNRMFRLVPIGLETFTDLHRDIGLIERFEYVGGTPHERSLDVYVQEEDFSGGAATAQP